MCVRKQKGISKLQLCASGFGQAQPLHPSGSPRQSRYFPPPLQARLCKTLMPHKPALTLPGPVSIQGRQAVCKRWRSRSAGTPRIVLGVASSPLWFSLSVRMLSPWVPRLGDRPALHLTEPQFPHLQYGCAQGTRLRGHMKRQQDALHAARHEAYGKGSLCMAHLLFTLLFFCIFGFLGFFFCLF